MATGLGRSFLLGVCACFALFVVAWSYIFNLLTILSLVCVTYCFIVTVKDNLLQQPVAVPGCTGGSNPPPLGSPSDPPMITYLLNRKQQWESLHQVL